MDSEDRKEFFRIKTFEELYKFLVNYEMDLLDFEDEELIIPIRLQPGQYFKLLRWTHWRQYESGYCFTGGCL